MKNNKLEQFFFRRRNNNYYECKINVGVFSRENSSSVGYYCEFSTSYLPFNQISFGSQNTSIYLLTKCQHVWLLRPICALSVSKATLYYKDSDIRTWYRTLYIYVRKIHYIYFFWSFFPTKKSQISYTWFLRGLLQMSAETRFYRTSITHLSIGENCHKTDIYIYSNYTAVHIMFIYKKKRVQI